MNRNSHGRGRKVAVFSQTLNSIGWHHSSNQRHLLHFSIVLVFIVTKSQIWPKFRPQKIRVRGPGFFPRIVLRYIFIFELFWDSADGQKNLSKPVSEHCSKFRRVRPTRRGNHRRGNNVDAPRQPRRRAAAAIPSDQMKNSRCMLRCFNRPAI